MPGRRRKDVVLSRRRTKDDGDEDDGLVMTEAIDDSQSEASLPTDADDNVEADDSDLSASEVIGPSGSLAPRHKSHGRAVKGSFATTKEHQVPKRSVSEPHSVEISKETEPMLNRTETTQGHSRIESPSFDATETVAEAFASDRKPETVFERRRREHDEYKKKRDSDPSFIPTRGAFFMHDQRHVSSATGSLRAPREGRGRGRSRVSHLASPSSAASQWSHDLHETLLEPTERQYLSRNTSNGSSIAQSRLAPAAPSPAQSSSSTRIIGRIQIRVLLPCMKQPVTYSDVTVKHYTKLPNHRPPLRRDKAVRVSIPDHPARYMFPALERSFVFIPRALRPNQQAFGRGRGKGFGGMGGFSSRRTSIFNGSTHSSSIMSRRSSGVRDGLTSPATSSIGRPTVRLPPSAQQHTTPGTQVHSTAPSTTDTTDTTDTSDTPVYAHTSHPSHSSEPPSHPPDPSVRENWTSPLQMVHPRPLKTISMTSIEYPASVIAFQPPVADQPSYNHEAPPPTVRSAEPVNHAQNRQQSFSRSAAVPTLSNIPEGAIYAQPFQPYQQTGYIQYPINQPSYYYPGTIPVTTHFTAGPVMAPSYAQPQPQQQPMYMIPAEPSTQTVPPGAGRPGLIAREVNGMVFYDDPSNSPYPDHAVYPQPAYPMAGMMMPGTENYYYPSVSSGTIFYSQQ